MYEHGAHCSRRFRRGADFGAAGAREAATPVYVFRHNFSGDRAGGDPFSPTRSQATAGASGTQVRQQTLSIQRDQSRLDGRLLLQMVLPPMAKHHSCFYPALTCSTTPGASGHEKSLFGKRKKKSFSEWSLCMPRRVVVGTLRRAFSVVPSYARWTYHVGGMLRLNRGQVRGSWAHQGGNGEFCNAHIEGVVGMPRRGIFAGPCGGVRRQNFEVPGSQALKRDI